MWEDPLADRAARDLELPLPKREAELVQPYEEPSAQSGEDHSPAP
jgi:hypothetical protein